ncbi:MAG: hypothetical protein V3S11_01450, partial [Elusimicrobiota bacterium]
VQARSFLKQAGLTITGRLTRPAPPGSERLNTERAGGIRVPADLADPLERTVAYLRENTRPEEPVWAFPNEAMLNFLADRPSASPYVLGLFALTREMRREMVAALDRSRPRYAVHYTEAYPVDRIPHRTAMREQWEYLERRYVPEKRFGPVIVLRRREGP